MNCDLPVSDIEQQLEKRWHRTHCHAPSRERSGWDPHSNAKVPYWFVTEVEV
ncbi:hypothetical protein D777_00504 [Marinobacter nitratireducens]|uniref:Uncharacterized protein n=1 Tax=Marinobacter nitratireducens TaxID=1137280 RepID=A0A072N6P3_9GAMM|nr:hypothetical protein D777_00504 [Marinobacter nitratireducens]